MTIPVYQNFIDGHFLANQSGETFAVKNPSTDDVIYHVEVADAFIQNAAIQSARQGFSAWAGMTPIQRSRILLKAVTLLRERNDELAKVEVLDTGKPWQEAQCVDVQTGTDVIEYFAGLAPTQVGQQQMVGEDFYYTRKEPLGICAGIGAWNHPLQIAC